MKKYILLSLLFFCNASIMMGQEKQLTISGHVFDESNESLPGVSVYLKDRAGVGTSTDINGAFKLSAQKGDMIIFSFIGYKKMEHIVLKDEKNLRIMLKSDSQQMDEVVITGMGTKEKKVNLTGAVTNVDISQIQTPATSLTNMLGGRVPGIISVQSSGEPGSNMSEFWIRGIGTFGASSSALVLIDGLEGDLNSIDPADIESFSVLKDASATAVYGVRGANGVVLVTTKHGTSDKMEVNVRANVKISYLTKLPEYLRAYDYAVLANEASAMRGAQPIYDDIELKAIQYHLDPDFYPDVNWQDEILKRTSLQQTYYASARGGGSIARYFVSMNMSNESAIYKQDENSKYIKDVHYNTYGMRLNVDFNLTKTTELYFGSDIYLSSQALPGQGASTDQLWDAQAKLTPLTIPVRYSTGELPTYKSGAKDVYSPYAMLNYTGLKNINTYSGTYTIRLQQDFSFLLRNLALNIQGAYSNSSYFEETRSVKPDMYWAERRDENGNLELIHTIKKEGTKYTKNRDSQYRKYFLQANLTWKAMLNDEHRISALIHYEMSDSKNTKDLNKDGMAAIPLRYQGLSGKVSYGFRDTYLLDFNIGYTGSENFEKGKRFGFFPAISGGWVPTQYEFMQEKLPWLNFLKIRASYGIVGNDRISDKRFPYLTIINESAEKGWGYNEAGITENQMGADNLKWETVKKIDVGIEGELFNPKLSFVIDFFKDIRDGIFQQRQQVPEYIGLVSMPFGNVGSMKSYGSDGNVTYIQNIGKDMSVTFRGNFTLSNNRVNYFEEADTKYEYNSATGRPYGYQKGLIALGLFKDDEDIANSPKQTFGSYLPGDIKYKDVNGDGVVNGDDKVPLSFSSTPRFMYGFGVEFRYKRLSAAVLFKGTGNTDVYHVGVPASNGALYDEGYIPFYGKQTGNVLSIVKNPANRWISREYAEKMGLDPSLSENPNARFPRMSYGNLENNSQTSSFWKNNAKYLRLSEVNINYSVNVPKTIKNLGINSIDLSLVGNNLCVWDKIDICDPEQALYNGRRYPIPASVTLQAYIKF